VVKYLHNYIVDDRKDIFMEFITYEMFGAVGNGVTDDMPAIVRAHEEANKKMLPVKAKEDAVYYISPKARFTHVMTDTDWTGAEFIIDDRDCEDRNLCLFSVSHADEPVTLDIPALHEGQDYLDNPLGIDLYVRVKNEEHRDYIRRGLNQNNGTARNENFILRADGTIPTPICFEFEKVTSASAYPIPKTKLTLKGGKFTTIANQCESKYNYHARNIRILRGNVEVSGITHYVTGELDHGAPYGGFLTVSDCTDVYVHDCVFTGHKTYTTIGSAGKPVSMGSYDISLGNSANVIFRRCSQTNDITDSSRWGIIGSNYCRDTVFEDCDFSRYDAHQGVINCVIKRCRLGHAGINAIGFGTFTIEDTETYGASVVNLRSDYGSTFKGKFIIRNCKWHQRSPERTFFGASNDGTHDFGYICYLPQEIDIDGLEVICGTESSAPLYVFNNYSGNPEIEPSARAYMPIPPVSVRLKNIKSGRKVELCELPSLMPDTEFISQ